MTLREFIVVTHRWMGLASGLVLALVGLTGSVLVWPARFPGRSLISEAHEALALGAAGRWAVLIATGIAILLQLGGLYLWLRSRIVTARWRGSWQKFAFDLHHAVGVIGFVLMLVLAVTAIGRVVMREVPSASAAFPGLRSVMVRYHAGEGFHPGIKVLYMLASAGYAVQAASGTFMWWRSRAKAIQSPSSRRRI